MRTSRSLFKGFSDAMSAAVANDLIEGLRKAPPSFWANRATLLPPVHYIATASRMAATVDDGCPMVCPFCPPPSLLSSPCAAAAAAAAATSSPAIGADVASAAGSTTAAPSPSMAFIAQGLPIMTQVAFRSHLAWRHIADGAKQSDFHRYNTRVLDAAARNIQAGTRRFMVVDVANTDISSSDEIPLLQSLNFGRPDVQQFFATHATNFIAVTEMFLMPPIKTLDVLYQLSRLHPGSGMFVIYAGNRSENGDFVAAATMNKLQQVIGGGSSCKMVLVTRDERQRVSCTQMLSPACVIMPAGTAEAVLEALVVI